MKAAIMRRLGKEEKGFTLIELLAVIVILAVIAAIAVPLIGNVISKSKDSSDISTARQIYDAARIYITSDASGEFANKTVTLEQLQQGGYLEASIVLPSSKAVLTSAQVIYDADGDLQEVLLMTGTATATSPTKKYSGAEVIKNEVNAQEEE